ncbi:hypothetical protein TRAPUB_171, partial [Trametes pubescens]
SHSRRRICFMPQPLQPQRRDHVVAPSTSFHEGRRERRPGNRRGQGPRDSRNRQV